MADSKKLFSKSPILKIEKPLCPRTLCIKLIFLSTKIWYSLSRTTCFSRSFSQIGNSYTYQYLHFSQTTLIVIMGATFFLIYQQWNPTSYITISFWCQTINEKFFRRFDTIFGLEMMVKSGLEKIILRFHDGLQTCCCPVQKNLPRKAELAWQISRYLWRPPWNFKIFFSRPLFTIIFKPKMVSNICKNFLCIAWH